MGSSHDYSLFLIVLLVLLGTTVGVVIGRYSARDTLSEELCRVAAQAARAELVTEFQEAIATIQDLADRQVIFWMLMEKTGRSPSELIYLLPVLKAEVDHLTGIVERE